MAALLGGLGALGGLAGDAAAEGPAHRPQSSLRRDLAAALGVPVEQLVGEVSAVDLTQAGDASGVVLGLYREKPESKWTFPAIGVYHKCAAGSCVARARLGASSSRVLALELVDLDAPRTQVAVRTSFGPGPPPLVEPPSRARFPALLVACVRDLDDSERLVELEVISLRDPARPQELGQLTLERSSPEPKGEGRAPGPPTRGTRIEGLSFARAGDERTMVVVDRLIDTRFNHCLRPEPGEQRYLLDGEHYREVSSKPSRMCH